MVWMKKLADIISEDFGTDKDSEVITYVPQFKKKIELYS